MIVFPHAKRIQNTEDSGASGAWPQRGSRRKEIPGPAGVGS